MRVARWLLAVVILLAGCGGGSQHSPEEKYYLLSTNVKIPYWQTANNGCQ